MNTLMPFAIYAEEAKTDPEMVKNAPHRSVVHKIDESWFDDPETMGYNMEIISEKAWN